jgi:hypothetical protein
MLNNKTKMITVVSGHEIQMVVTNFVVPSLEKQCCGASVCQYFEEDRRTMSNFDTNRSPLAKHPAIYCTEFANVTSFNRPINYTRSKFILFLQQELKLSQGGTASASPQRNTSYDCRKTPNATGNKAGTPKPVLTGSPK